MADIATIVQKLVAPMHNRVMLMIGRAIVTLVNDSTLEQSVQLQLLNGYKRDNVERYQQYGFTSVPLPGSEAITVAVTSSTDHLVAIASGDRRYRPKNLNPGEVAIYTNEGAAFYATCTGNTNSSGVLPTHYAARADRVEAQIAKIWLYLLLHSHTGAGVAPTQPDPGGHDAGATAADKAMVE